MVRTPELVKASYAANWGRLNSALQTTPPATLQDVILQTFDPEKSGTYLIEGRLAQTTYAAFNRYKFSYLFSLVEPHLKTGARFTEFGCGWGVNLFCFRHLRPDVRYSGFDGSFEGIDLARRLNAQFHLDIDFTVLDLCRSDARPACDVIFTHFAMEMLKSHTESVLEFFASLRPSVVIHVEPVVELYRPFCFNRDYFSRRRIAQKDHQDRLLSSLKKMEAGGRVTLREARRLGMGSNPLHEASLIVWSPRGS